MKQNLGKAIFILLFTAFTLYAKTSLASYELSSNIKTASIKEAVEIKFTTTQKDKTHVMFFFLKPKISNDYKIILLNKKEEELSYHYKKTTFTYLLFPLKAKKIEVDFNFTIKVASDEAIAQVYQGSRDNVKWIETINTLVKLKPLVIYIKPIKEDVDLVGDFSISSKIQKKSVNSYESVNVIYNINGTGYNEFQLAPIQKIENVNIFSDISKKDEKATANGYKINREFNYALISNKDYIIDSKKIKCYSPKKDKIYYLQTKSYSIKVTDIKKSQLLDKVDNPTNKENFEGIKNTLIYTLIFLLGFISAKISPKISIRNKKFRDIKECSSSKELLYLLMHKYENYKLKKYYEILNEMVYNDDKTHSLKSLKLEILKNLEKKI